MLALLIFKCAHLNFHAKNHIYSALKCLNFRAKKWLKLNPVMFENFSRKVSFCNNTLRLFSALEP